MSLEEMLLRDELRSENTTSGEIERLLDAIGRRLDDAGNETNHPETRLDQAYHAILNCALVGLRALDLRPSDRRGHHIVILESLTDTLGTDPQRVDYFQTLRDLRNKDLYTGGTRASVQQAEEACEEAWVLRDELMEWLKRREPAT